MPSMFTNARAYDQFMGKWSRQLAPVLVEFARLSNAGQVLDVGCGIGALAFTVAKLYPNCNVVGVDASMEYIDYAISCNDYANVQFKVGSANHLEFSKAAFDNCMSLLVLNFIPNAQAALSEMMRVTRTGGHVTAAVWDYGGSMEMLSKFWEAAITLDANAERFDERKMPLCIRGELSTLWELAGFYDIGEQAIEIEMYFKSFQDYWEPFLLGQGPAGAYVKQLDKDRALVLRKAVKDLLGIDNEANPVALRGRAWAVRGRVPESLRTRHDHSSAR